MKINIYLLLLLALIACGKSEIDVDCIEVDYNKAIDVTPDSRYCFPDGTELHILNLNNQYCPCNTTCVWDGQLVIDMEWIIKGSIESSVFGASDSWDNDPIDNGNITLIVDNDSIEFSATCEEDANRKIKKASIIVRK